MKLTLRPLHGFKPGALIYAELLADGSILVTDEPHTADADRDDIKAAYLHGIRTSASEQVELLAARSEGGKTLRPFRMTAYTGAAMRLDGFYRPVMIDLEGITPASRSLPILREHDPGRIVAHTEDVQLSERSLKASGLISGVGPDAQEVLQLADNGFPWQASVGASVDRMEYLDAKGTATINGRTVVGPLALARQSTLHEISFVPLGADPSTSAKVSGGN